MKRKLILQDIWNKQHINRIITPFGSYQMKWLDGNGNGLSP
jgi:hypothetical protein